MRKRILLLTTAFIIAVSSLPGVAFADTDVDINEISVSTDSSGDSERGLTGGTDGSDQAVDVTVSTDAEGQDETDGKKNKSKDTEVTATDADENLVGTQSRTSGFVGGYKLTGNGATDILNVAYAQIDRKRKDFGYTEDWCADFVSDCAKLAGNASAIPADGLVMTLRTGVIKAGGTYQTKANARPGDLIIFDWPDNDDPNHPATYYDHVEIVCENSGGYITCIGGNTRTSTYPEGVVSKTKYAMTYIKEVIRPNYKQTTQTEAPSISGVKDPPLQMKKGTFFEVHGTVTCQKKLQEVEVYVYDEKGKKVTGKTVHPKATFFDLHTVDDDVLFSDLPLGRFEYRISATVEGAPYKLYSKWFHVVQKPSSTIKAVPMYRLFYGPTLEHFYTSSTHERDVLIERGWRDEGIGWYAPEDSNTPVFRLYNPVLKDHHYTTSVFERDSLTERSGWIYEGIGWYSDDEKTVPLYRCFNPFITSGAHHYTTANNEAQHLVTVGWKHEGIAWYGVKKS